MANHDYIASCGCNGCTIGRLTRELGDARQSIIDLQGANAAYVRANGKLRAELQAVNRSSKPHSASALSGGRN